MDTIMAEKLIQIRIDEKVKTEAESVLNKHGVTLTTAVRMMLYHVASTKTTPFDNAFDPNK